VSKNTVRLWYNTDAEAAAGGEQARCAFDATMTIIDVAAIDAALKGNDVR
jgi:hypothetical protein